MSSSRGAIGFLLHPRETDGRGPIHAARERAAAHGFSTWLAGPIPGAAVSEHAGDTDLLITVGGDGTFLLGARLGAAHGIPVLGVNRGQLGFLTDVELGDLPEAVDRYATGDYRLSRRSLLEREVVQPDHDAPPVRTALALNEVAVRSTSSNLARVRVEADDDLLGEFDADGVVIATATGSTAYALSAGGPPVDPRVRATVVVPLAPHAVITRAVVVPEAMVLVVVLVHGRAFAAADGTAEVPLREGARVLARPGPELQVVTFPGSPTFLCRLREKVRFGMPLKEAIDALDWHHPDGTE